ncbi:MAG: hypothetical protein D6812_09205 [Deltaproteobacteria bacterium]|nr:MAG: hypothetical protein D6812_09205 [Deltaproteobacteria bacterium]
MPSATRATAGGPKGSLEKRIVRGLRYAETHFSTDARWLLRSSFPCGMPPTDVEERCFPDGMPFMTKRSPEW